MKAGGKHRRLKAQPGQRWRAVWDQKCVISPKGVLGGGQKESLWRIVKGHGGLGPLAKATGLACGGHGER